MTTSASSEREKDLRHFADWKLTDWGDYRNMMRVLTAELVAEKTAELTSLRSSLSRKDEEIEGLQARIDELMLEYCPGEMTPEQIAEWERHQVPSLDGLTADDARKMVAAQAEGRQEKESGNARNL